MEELFSFRSRVAELCEKIERIRTERIRINKWFVSGDFYIDLVSNQDGKDYISIVIYQQKPAVIRLPGKTSDVQVEKHLNMIAAHDLLEKIYKYTTTYDHNILGHISRIASCYYLV